MEYTQKKTQDKQIVLFVHLSKVYQSHKAHLPVKKERGPMSQRWMGLWWTGTKTVPRGSSVRGRGWEEKEGL